MPEKTCTTMRRKHFHPTQFACGPGPVELVFLVAMQEVVLKGSLFNSCLDRKPHRGNSDAVFAVSRIKTRLIEVKGRTVTKPVKCRRRLSIQPENEEAQPAFCGRRPCKVSVKRNDIGRLKC